MITIGLRASPDSVTFAVFCNEQSRLLNVETLKIPKALAVPDALKFVRNTVLDILKEYKIDKAGLRISESNAQRFNIERVSIEGVIQEALASSEVKAYYCGQISNISAKIGFRRQLFKEYIAGDYPRIENWNELNVIDKEAVFTAIGAVNA